MTVPTVVIMPKKKKNTAGAIADDDFVHIDAGYTYPKQCIDELLELAGNSSPQSRCDLGNALQLAQMDYEDEKGTSSRQRPRSKQIEQFEKSIEKTSVLLRRIRRYDDFRNIGFVTQQVGRGVVAPAAQGAPKSHN
jgi:hypothetical protein